MAARRRQVETISDEVVPETVAPPVDADPEDVVITVEDAPEDERETGTCRLCGRHLTAEVSVVRGLGPVCAGHVARLLEMVGLKLTAKEGEDGYTPEEMLA